MESLSLAEARRIVLGAQGFGAPRPAGRSGRARVRRVIDRLGALQLDSVNVLVRAHEMPLWARLGEHDRRTLLAMLDAGELFEYWGHQASVMPIADWPLFAWRMASARTRMWKHVARIGEEQPGFVERVAAEVEARGAATAGDLHPPGRRRGGSWWDLSDTKIALEWLFWTGRVTARRKPNFERVYLPLCALPEAVRRVEIAEDAARIELLARSARALGLGTQRDLMTYYMLNAPRTRGALRALEERGDVRRVRVEGWKQPALVHRDAIVPRRIGAATLLSPFDALLWDRSRVERLFRFHYRIEIYTPAPKRVHGYYVLPFLLGERLVARVDLKADRSAGVLRVLAAWTEDHAAPADVADPLATELAAMASWLGLDSVAVTRRGDLAVALAAAVRRLCP